MSTEEVELEKLGFMRSRAEAIQKTFMEFSTKVVQTRPFRRATTAGLVLMGLGVGTALLSAIFSSFAFATGMSISMLLLGGAMFILGIVGDVWLKKNIFDKLLESDTLTTEAISRQQTIVNELASSPVDGSRLARR